MRIMTRLFLLVIIVWLLAINQRAALATQPKFTPPPAQETDLVRKLIADAEADLRSGKNVSEILTNPSYSPAHEWPRFRKLIRQNAQSPRATIVTRQEPGQPLLVHGRVLDSDNRPVRGAVVYVYQTSSNGWYSDRAAHVEAHEGDRKHARLFGYMKTDDDGRFELRTIRPAGYPNSDLPSHIHVEIEPKTINLGNLVTEIQFDDDPRLTAEWRKRSRQEGFRIVKTTKDSAGSERGEIEFKLR
jgi:protocatechuate 3,4-dioxygenase beta subunit